MLPMSHVDFTPIAGRGGRRRFARGAAFALTLLLGPLAASRAAAQTDYYNTDAGRPITIEDAYPVERRAVEIQVAPLRLERANGGVYAWGVEPELAVGLLPRTQLEVGLPLSYVDLGSGQRATGLAGIEVSALHNLNVETRIPALAVAVDVLIPVGALAPDRAYPSVKGIATKTFPWARFHVNGQYTFGERLGAADADGGAHGAAELSRWLGGVAVDRALPLQSMLLTAELVARQPLADGAEVSWDAGAGTRYQLSPRVAADAGAGYRLTGDDRGWFVTFGAAVAVGLPWSPRR
jgi:hypothetical protein